MGNAILVVDMLVGFLEADYNLYCGDDVRRIIPNVRRLIEQEQAKGSKVFFICDTHDPDDLEFQIFPVHCMRVSKEAEVIKELSGYEGELIRERRRLLRDRPGTAPVPAKAGQGNHLRSVHGHLRYAYRRRRSQSQLSGSGPHRLCCHL